MAPGKRSPLLDPRESSNGVYDPGKADVCAVEWEEEVVKSQEGGCRRFWAGGSGEWRVEGGCGRKECGECVMRKAMGDGLGPWVEPEVLAGWVEEFMCGVEKGQKAEEGERVKAREADEDDEIFRVNAIGYPTARRPHDYHRVFDAEASDELVEEWFAAYNKAVGEGAETGEQTLRAKRLLYTWRDLFEDDLSKVPVCELVQYHIPTYPGTRPHRAANPIYTLKDITWMKENIPTMVTSGIVTDSGLPWSSRPKFVRKTRGDLRMVHVYCPLNKAAVKSNYPMRRIEPIVQSLMQWQWTVFWQAVATVGYWGIRLAP